MTTRALEFAGFIAHSRTRGYLRRLQQAREIVAKAMRTGAPHVALSGGKDSTVVMELCRELFTEIPCVWSDDVFFLPETLAYIKQLKAAGVNIHHIRTNAKHRDWFMTEGDYNSIDDYAQRELGSNCVMLGLRKEENRYRRVHLDKLGTLFFAKSTQMWHCNPIANWTAMDVWAFIASTGCPYNHAYDKLAEMGVSLERQRIGPYATDRALEYGSLALIRQGWPDEYQRFIAAHPEGAMYT